MKAISGTPTRVPGGGPGAEAQASRLRGDDEPHARPTAGRWLVVALIAGVIAVGVAMRFVARSDLWSDEALAVNIAKVPLGDLPHALRQDGSPPLYYLLLHFWMRVFGSGDVAVRALSGVFAAAALPVAWFAGRRLDDRRVSLGDVAAGDRAVAWATVLLLASSPFAVRFGTEARMYSLITFLVFLGYLAVARALDQPTVPRLIAVGAVTSLLIYTHYWTFFLVAVVVAWLACLARRAPWRRPARRTLVAIGLAFVPFVPWFPTFWFQLRHTGTPFAGRVFISHGYFKALGDFGGGRTFGGVLAGFAVLAVLGVAINSHRFEIELRSHRGVRTEAALGVATLGLGLVVGYLLVTTFDGRYAATMFPLFVLVVAFGFTVFASRIIRYALLACVVVGSFAGSVSSVRDQRTQAFRSVSIIERDARPGDVVAYCPDSLGPDAARLLRAPVHQITYPGGSPDLIDWIDYNARIDHTAPSRFASRVVQRAGAGHTIWYVWNHGVQGLAGRCESIMDALDRARPDHTRMVEPDTSYYEHQGLVRYGATGNPTIK